MDQKDERKLLVCASEGKKRMRSRKFGDESDDSDEDRFSSKGKKSKSRKLTYKASKLV